MKNLNKEEKNYVLKKVVRNLELVVASVEDNREIETALEKEVFKHPLVNDIKTFLLQHTTLDEKVLLERFSANMQANCNEYNTNGFTDASDLSYAVFTTDKYGFNFRSAPILYRQPANKSSVKQSPSTFELTPAVTAIIPISKDIAVKYLKYKRFKALFDIIYSKTDYDGRYGKFSGVRKIHNVDPDLDKYWIQFNSNPANMQDRVNRLDILAFEIYNDLKTEFASYFGEWK